MLLSKSIVRRISDNFLQMKSKVVICHRFSQLVFRSRRCSQCLTKLSADMLRNIFIIPQLISQ